MTAGRSILKTFSWSLKSKKRERSGSGGSADLKKKSGTSLPSKSRRLANRKGVSEGPVCSGSEGSSLEIVAPASSDVEFKYSWPINGFIHQVKTGGRTEGLDSKPFEVNVNGIHTTWSLSVRFWVGENGEKLSNPFVLCLNLVSCKVERSQEVRVKYRFGIYNRTTEEPEMGAPERVTLKQETIDKLQSVGYKNIAMNEKHVNSAGDIILFVRLSIIREEEANHSLSSDLKSLINDEKSSDLILEAGERKFLVHKNILAARSPVFADLLARMDLCSHGGICDDRSESAAATAAATSMDPANNPDPEKLVPIQESSHSSSTSRDIRLLEDLDTVVRKLDNIQETDGEAEEINESQDDTKENHEIQKDLETNSKLEQQENNINQNEPEKEKVVQSNEPSAVEKKVVDDEIIATAAESVASESSVHSSVKELERKDSRDEMFADQRMRKESQDRRKLVIDDLPGDTVEELLKYIYTDSSHNVEAFSQTLLAASDKYKLPGLKQHCEKHLVEILSPVNVSDILLLSASYGCKDLKKAALTYCGDNHSYIMKDSKWKTIEKENPDLFEEAISLVAPDSCDKHTECLKKGGNRYEAEKMSTKGNLGLVGRKKSTVARKI